MNIHKWRLVIQGIKKTVDSMGELCHYHVINSWLLMNIQLSRHLDILYLHVDGSIPMFQFSPSEAYAKRKCTWSHRPDFIFLWKHHITTASFCFSSWQLYCELWQKKQGRKCHLWVPSLWKYHPIVEELFLNFLGLPLETLFVCQTWSRTCSSENTIYDPRQHEKGNAFILHSDTYPVWLVI